MCGATGAQTSIEQSQQQFYQQLTNEYSTVFGEDQSILGQLTSSLQPIIQAGPNQQGFGAAENTALNTEATEGTATNYAMAKQALQEDQAAQGGDVPVGSGSNQEMDANLAAKAASTQSGLQTEITQANYDTGRQNYQNAVGDMEGVASEYNPAGFAGATTGAGSAAANTANTIAADSNSVWSSVLGALGGVAGKAVGNINYSSGSGFSFGGGS